MKKSIILTLVVLAILSFGMISFADSNQNVDESSLEFIQSEVNETNDTIDKLIVKYVAKADIQLRIYEKKVNALNLSLTGEVLQNALVALDNENEEIINGIIDELIYLTGKVANEMIEKAAEYGITVVCEFVPVEIGGKIILIDPIKIVGV